MAAGQPLRGFVGQSMAAKKKAPQFIGAGTGPVNQFPPGSYTFVIPTTGKWKFVAWAAGGGGSSFSSGQAAGSGAYGEISRYLNKGQSVSITVGAGGLANGGSTTIVLPDGTTCTATGGIGTGTTGAGGTASGFDVNLNGSAAGSAGQGTGGGAAAAGAGAPANLPFRGGAGSASSTSGKSPGGGSGDIGSSALANGGDGLVIAYLTVGGK